MDCASKYKWHYNGAAQHTIDFILQHGLILLLFVTDEGGGGRGRERLQLLLKEQVEVNLDDVKKYDDADDADSGDNLDSSDSDDDSDDDEEALEKELEKIRKEREEARKKKVHLCLISSPGLGTCTRRPYYCLFALRVENTLVSRRWCDWQSIR